MKRSALLPPQPGAGGRVCQKPLHTPDMGSGKWLKSATPLAGTNFASLDVTKVVLGRMTVKKQLLAGASFIALWSSPAAAGTITYTSGGGILTYAES
jgi:hypothetical protein